MENKRKTHINNLINNTSIEDFEKNLKELDEYHKIVDCSFKQDNYMKSRIFLEKIIEIKRKQK